MTDRKFPTGKVMGFDLSSGPDHSAAATFRVKGGEWTLEDLERISPHATRLSEEFMRREAEARARAQEEQIFRAMYGDARANPFRAGVSDPPWDWNPARAGHPHAKTPAVEIISDPADRRGMDARQIGPGR
ncbi:MAG: hypothetical protein Tp170SUR191951_29 [Prokaryotic dsDNA virus sp.]|nr:hypothetical protein [Pseudomonas sp.]MBS67329.1 hypothetical protein [Pseudomonas sp.]QDP55191.1 MAG: hypothetical protein Tp170SUR191951_29 [Prokaryotic dsDNA virus sp.]|tara:strand:- start:1990 stop:2382 length:393 start_codon:yes stop_codon:yes gene_type:complete